MIIWTKEKCLQSASKYTKRIDWYKFEQSAYQAARKNNWFDECTVHMKLLVIPWTEEKCVENAKKYTTISEWIKNQKRAYEAAIRYGWLDECIKHMPSRIVLNKETCISIAKKYNSIADWVKADRKSYYTAWRKNWLKECTSHMKIKNWKKRGYWTKEKCIETAKQFKRLSDWIKFDNGKAYNAAIKNKWLKECTSHMLKRVSDDIWKKVDNLTKDDCINSAKKHNRINNWIKKDRPAFKIAKLNGWLDECTAHMKKVKHWTKEKCLESAKNFNQISSWQKDFGSAYNIARLNGWLDECTVHMKKNKVNI